MKRRTPDDDSDPDLLDEWKARKKPGAGFRLTTPRAIVLAGMLISFAIITPWLSCEYRMLRTKWNLENEANRIREMNKQNSGSLKNYSRP